METLINPATKQLVEDGITVTNGHVQVEIIRSIFDTKMAGLLDGAGGASCHLCTATGKEINSLEWARAGYPINRYITDTNQLFEEFDENEVFHLPSKKRCGITHHPTSEINIVAASPLHAYLCVFRWYMLVIYHLDAACKKWSPTSTIVQDSKKRVTAILESKCSLKIDIPSSQGGTSTTGNVARDCFMDKRDFFRWATSSINPIDKPTLKIIQNDLSVILRIVNSKDYINSNGLENLCKETYETILIQFPWVSISPSLHKQLAHCFQLISRLNKGYGLQNLSEECLEACNKYVRRYRENLSRKTSFSDNFRDIFVTFYFCALVTQSWLSIA